MAIPRPALREAVLWWSATTMRPAPSASTGNNPVVERNDDVPNTAGSSPVVKRNDDVSNVAKSSHVVPRNDDALNAAGSRKRQSGKQPRGGARR